MHSWFTLSSLPVYPCQCKLKKKNKQTNKQNGRPGVPQILLCVEYVGKKAAGVRLSTSLIPHSG